MKIAVIGTGNIGSELARVLARAGHTLTLANSRGPDTIQDLASELGATAATAEDAVANAQVVVLSIPFVAIPLLGELLRKVPQSTIVVDMSNYYAIQGSILDGADEAVSHTSWLSEQIGRPLVKAWNNLFSLSLATKGRPAGDPDRVALPVAGDDDQAKKVIMGLVEDSGFDAVDAGTLAGSWRMQPGSPAYCTDLAADALQQAMARADITRMREDRYKQVQAIYTPGLGASGMDMVNGVQIYRDITA